MTLDEFKAMVEAHIAASELTPTVFGRRFAGDPLFVFQLRDGREPREATRLKIIRAMEEDQAREAAE